MTVTPIIETDRLIFVELSEEYAEDIYEYASDEEVTRYVAWKKHSSINDTYDFLEYAKQSKNLRYHYDLGLLIKATNEFIGTIGTTNYQEAEKSLELGYVLNKRLWHRGLATEAAKSMCQFAFKMENIEKLNAYVFEGNIASRKVLEKCYFKNNGVTNCPILDYTGAKKPLQYSLTKSEFQQYAL